MIQDFQNHHGEFCWIKPTLFCQERAGCPDCQIYHNEKLCPGCEAHLENWWSELRERHRCEFAHNVKRDYIREMLSDEKRLNGKV